MGKKIYGVDLEKKITPEMVRDALIICFEKAHAQILNESKEYNQFNSKEEFRQFSKEEIVAIIKKIFLNIGGSFERPAKKDLILAVDALKEFCSNFRTKKIVEKHASKMMQLIERLVE
jgi:hypothetical protein